MKKLTILFCGFLLLTSVKAQHGITLKGVPLRNAGYSACVIDAENGSVIFETPQVSLVPASVMKVVTSAAALEILGPDFTFHTQIGYTGQIDAVNGSLQGDLVLKGGCDPAFYSEYFPDHYKGTFENWCSALVQAGIKRVQGDLIADLSQMDPHSVPDGWPWGDIGNYYGAGVSALTFNDNCYKIHFASPVEAGNTAVITATNPEIDSLRLVNNVVSSDINRDLTEVYGAPGNFSQLVEGSVPKGRTDFVIKATMPDPAYLAAAEFLKILKSFAIEFSGKIRLLKIPVEKPYTMLAEKKSPPLRDLIMQLNHESINLFAEHLLREIGRAYSGSTSPEKSTEALTEFWKGKNVCIDGFYPTDGSGLSRSNGICVRTLTDILRYMYLSSNRVDFFNSLPVAGVNGTLQNSFKGTKLENNLVAKTGSMTRVRSLAGIFTNKEGKKVIFAIITNNFEGPQASAAHVIESFIKEMYDPDSALLKQ